MDSASNATDVVTSNQPPLELSIGAAQGHLAGLGWRVRSVGHRAQRYSWFSWGFLFGLYGGVIGGGIVGIAIPVLGARLGEGLLFVFFFPALLLLTLAVRELFLGRREGTEPVSTAFLKAVGSGTEPGSGWTESVQQAQKILSRAKSEVDFSILPLVIGVLGIGSIITSVLFPAILSSLGGGILVELVLLLPIPFILLIWPLYRIARRWIAGYQTLLDRQVREFSRLESEFYWKFVGIPAPP